MNKSDLELIGAILYKCEGTKLRRDKRYPRGKTFYYTIEFTNSDPLLVKLFLRFLRKCVGIDFDQIRCELFLYPDQNVVDLVKKWTKFTGIDIHKFDKSIILKLKNSKFKQNPLGTCKIR